MFLAGVQHAKTGEFMEQENTKCRPIRKRIIPIDSLLRPTPLGKLQETYQLHRQAIEASFSMRLVHHARCAANAVLLRLQHSTV